MITDYISPGMAVALRYLAQHGALRSAAPTRFAPTRPGEFHGKTVGSLRRRGWIVSLGHLGEGRPLFALTPAGAAKIRERALDRTPLTGTAVAS